MCGITVFNYQDSLASKIIQDKIKYFLNNNYNEDKKDINKAVDDFNSIVTNSANQVFRRKNYKNNKNKFKPKPDKKWFDKECKILKKDTSETAKLLNKFPYDTKLREAFFVKKKKFKKMIKCKRKQEENIIVNKLKQLNNNNPTEFWKIINNLKDSNKDQNNPISPEKWVDYYKKLNCNDKLNDFQNDIINETKILENKENLNKILNDQVSEKEIKLAIKKLKCKKAAGYDGYCSELLKYGSDYLIKPLCKLFNLILNTGEYPDIWNISVISHIFKKGDRTEPGNYRGISVSSCIGKTFCIILNKSCHDTVPVSLRSITFVSYHV